MAIFYRYTVSFFKQPNTKKYSILFALSLISQFVFAQKPAPVISGITDISSTQAVVNWYPVANAESYIVRRYPKGTVEYTYYTPAVTDTFRKVVNMLPETHYSVQVKAIFPGVGDSSDWSEPKNFLTMSGCNPPTDLKAKKITDSSVKFRWTPPVTAVLKYDIRYRILGTSVWTEVTKKSTEKLINIKGLTANATYEWQMRSRCDDDLSVWVKGPIFSTAAGLATIGYTATDYNKSAIKITAQISPNPNRGNFTVQMQLPAKEVSTVLALYNIQGAKVWQQDAGKTGGTLYATISMEQKLTTGIYVLIVQRADARLVQKIIITK